MVDKNSSVKGPKGLISSALSVVEKLDLNFTPEFFSKGQTWNLNIKVIYLVKLVSRHIVMTAVIFYHSVYDKYTPTTPRNKECRF